LGKGLAERSTFFYVRVLPAQFPGGSLPGQPGNVLPAATAAVFHPGNVLLAATAAFYYPGKVSLAQQLR
jgi:hypothetical protein